MEDERSRFYKDRRRLLKVKLKSLAEEAKIIRKEEGRTKAWLRDELRNHRVGEVRKAARATHIAYGLIRGLPLDKIEKAKTPVPWEEVKRMCKKYGPLDQSNVIPKEHR